MLPPCLWEGKILTNLTRRALEKVYPRFGKPGHQTEVILVEFKALNLVTERIAALPGKTQDPSSEPIFSSHLEWLLYF